MKISVPELCLVALIGPSGSGKSSFGRKNFKPTEVISSDFCRGLVSDDENNQACTKEAFELVYHIASKRLAAGRLTVIDATNVQPDDRKQLIETAKANDCLAIAIVFDLPEKLCYERNATRQDRNFGDHVIHKQHSAMRRSIRNLEREGFRHVYVFNSEEKVDSVEIDRERMFNDRKDDHGPFDIIGDIHGCADELSQLLEKLGYKSIDTENGAQTLRHPDGRKAVFLGDLVDRGPKTPDVLKIVMSMVNSGNAICVPGNHDIKLLKKLRGRDVRITHGLKESLDQLAKESEQFRQDVARFIDKLVSHIILDDGRLVVAHAGMKREYQGRASRRVRDFALFGETTGETDDHGYPVRYNWAQDYRGDAKVVYGHTSVAEPEWINRTVCIDTGCVFGGKLTALKYPENEFVFVEAAQVYYEPTKPFLAALEQNAQAASEVKRDGDLLDIQDVIGRRVVFTELQKNITIREENAIAALEVMSRFAVNPRWLIYLPPTMSPCDTSKEPRLLEHPSAALKYFSSNGITKVVCEQKHMGSRAVLIVCKDDEVAERRFGISGEGSGICYTRTGRRFFNDIALQNEFICRVQKAIADANLWEELSTDWMALDCELMPWSAKAQELIRDQYAAVGSAASTSLKEAVAVLAKTALTNPDVVSLLRKTEERLEMAEKYREAYRGYCWEVNSLDDIKLAPFHLLASEGKVYFDHNHEWHMKALSKIAKGSDGLVIETPYKIIDLNDLTSYEEAIQWWFDLTAAGGEGFVVKPYDFIARNEKGLLQPAVKCRGREYLRIIYGPEYTAEEYLPRLRQRAVATKRSLAAREFALGAESLNRFVRHEPLYKVHECVFGVLALESEPVDSRL
ncbi:MAG: polynucleotide kinase-phosphatase [Candidatus Obscuribacterales bacterium]|nr:polynucleotide kinase-phosphatase [Candidatus Obscuribacterales bacterium]